MRFLLCVTFLFCLVVVVNADNIPAPTPSKDLPPELQHYLRNIYENFHNLQVVTVNPDGVRNGKKGDMVLLEVTGGGGSLYYLEINVDSSKMWSGVQLTNLP